MPGKETRILSVTTLSSESSRGTARRAPQVGAPAIAAFLGPIIEIVCSDALRTACVAIDCHVHCLLPNWRMDDMTGRLAHQFPVAVPRERDAFRVRIPSGSPGFAPVFSATHSRNRPHRAPCADLAPTGTPMSRDRGFRPLIGSHRRRAPGARAATACIESGSRITGFRGRCSAPGGGGESRRWGGRRASRRRRRRRRRGPHGRRRAIAGGCCRGSSGCGP